MFFFHLRKLQSTHEKKHKYTIYLDKMFAVPVSAATDKEISNVYIGLYHINITTKCLISLSHVYKLTVLLGGQSNDSGVTGKPATVVQVWVSTFVDMTFPSVFAATKKFWSLEDIFSLLSLLLKTSKNANVTAGKCLHTKDLTVLNVYNVFSKPCSCSLSTISVCVLLALSVYQH